MCQGRQLLVAVAFLLGFGAAVGRAQPVSAPPEMLEDAELTDVFFLDEHRGWAVGDRGVIWLTQDGGRQWQLSDSPVNCRLEAVWFIDERHGWAVGGWMRPYSHSSSAVVLYTDSGGRRWTQLPAETLPKLLQVRFFDRRQGWALGVSSAMYPAGVFRTQDGGRSWSPSPPDQTAAWLAADFRDPSFGLLVGREGVVAAVGQRGMQRLAAPGTRLRHLHAARATADGRFWIAGDGGFAAISDDGGKGWRTISLPSSPELSSQIDFRSLDVRGNKCWLAGNPGSVVCRSADGGRSWQFRPTQHAAPLNAIRFLDERRGWAVGALGTILATSDGGETWMRQRSGGTRVAVLGLFAESEQVPLELFTQLCGDEGYLGSVELLTRRDVEVKDALANARDSRAVAGLSAAGGSCLNNTWRFPLRQAGLQLTASAILQGWTLANGRDGVQSLEEYAVLRIRQWRPEIIVTQAADPTAQDPLSHIVNQVVLSAVERAADPAAYEDQLQVLGLSPWRTKKVFALARSPNSATVLLESSRFSTRLGQSIRDHTLVSRGLLQERWSPGVEQSAFELLMTSLPRSQAGRDFFTGLTVPPGSDCRRRAGSPAPLPLAVLGRRSQKQRALELLLTRAADDERNAAAWLAQVDDLTSDLSPLAAGEMLYQLSQHYIEIGSLSLAAESLETLLERCPAHPVAEASLVWLMQYHASREVASALRSVPAAAAQERETTKVVAAFNAALPPGVGQQLQLVHVDRAGVERAGLQTPADDTDWQRLMHVSHKMKEAFPALTAEPKLRFIQAAAARARGAVIDAQREYQQIAATQPPGPWQQAARGELWLENRQGQCPKSWWSCRRGNARPLLDGVLNDPCWAAAAAVDLTSQLQDDADWPARVWLARDDEYLYFAAQCGKAAGLNYDESRRPRHRDADLRQRDRVELLLDLDRDYNTFFRLSVDSRGWTGEACWGDSRWNPDWFVAAGSDAASWTIEAAIPLQELGVRDVSPGQIWAVGVQRIVPTIGFQSWNIPASVVGQPEGFAFLALE